MPNDLPSTTSFVGLDVASESFHATLVAGPDEILAGPTAFANEPDGFGRLAAWLAEHGAKPADTVVCMEATGVYSEALCYALHEHGYRVAVEDPLRIKRAFKTSANKTDPADSRQIATYAARYLDELRLWHPNEAVVEQIKVLLAMREQLVREKSAKQNALHVLRRKAAQSGAKRCKHQRPTASRKRCWPISKSRSEPPRRRLSVSSGPTPCWRRP